MLGFVFGCGGDWKETSRLKEVSWRAQSLRVNYSKIWLTTILKTDG